MIDIINLYLYEEYIKSMEKIPVTGWNEKVATRINKFTTKEGMLECKVTGAKENYNRILVI